MRLCTILCLRCARPAVGPAVVHIATSQLIDSGRTSSTFEKVYIEQPTVPAQLHLSDLPPPWPVPPPNCRLGRMSVHRQQRRNQAHPHRVKNRSLEEVNSALWPIAPTTCYWAHASRAHAHGPPEHLHSRQGRPSAVSPSCCLRVSASERACHFLLAVSGSALPLLPSHFGPLRSPCHTTR